MLTDQATGPLCSPANVDHALLRYRRDQAHAGAFELELSCDLDGKIFLDVQSHG